MNTVFVDRYGALNTAAQTGKAYLAFVAVCQSTRHRWAGDEDIAAFEAAAGCLLGRPVIAEELSSSMKNTDENSWAYWAREVFAGRCKWVVSSGYFDENDAPHEEELSQ